MTASLGGKVQRGLGAGYHLMGACWRLVFSRIVVASTIEGSANIIALIDLEDGNAE